MTTAAKLEQYSHLPHQIMQQELYSGLKEYFKIVCSSNSKYFRIVCFTPAVAQGTHWPLVCLNFNVLFFYFICMCFYEHHVHAGAQ